METFKSYQCLVADMGNKYGVIPWEWPCAAKEKIKKNIWGWVGVTEFLDSRSWFQRLNYQCEWAGWRESKTLRGRNKKAPEQLRKASELPLNLLWVFTFQVKLNQLCVCSWPACLVSHVCIDVCQLQSLLSKDWWTVLFDELFKSCSAWFLDSWFDLAQQFV